LVWFKATIIIRYHIMRMFLWF